MNYEDALSFIHSNFWQGSKPGLSRTRDLLERIGNPQNKLKFIHVAGTNGKGSFCAMLSSILIESGLCVGTYTSPYILRFNERMKVNGKDIPDQTLAKLTEWIRPFTEAMEEKPTEFELITAIAMEYFARSSCDVVVLECGMGGRLDSTNVIETPLLAVITGIALDHTAFLGTTVREIAAEKAGIIKSKGSVLYCGSDPEAEEVIRKKAEQCEASLLTVNRDGFEIKKQDLSGTAFRYGKRKGLTLSLLGSYQIENVQNVLSAVDFLQSKGLDISEDAVKMGLKKVRWPARFELVHRSPVIICDGGHNPQGVDAAVQSAETYFGKQKCIIVTGVMADKDYSYMVRQLCSVGAEAFCLTPSNPRALGAKELAETFRRFGLDATACSSPEEALSAAVTRARATSAPILCVGSLYMYGQIVAALPEATK